MDRKTSQFLKYLKYFTIIKSLKRKNLTFIVGVILQVLGTHLITNYGILLFQNSIIFISICVTNKNWQTGRCFTKQARIRDRKYYQTNIKTWPQIIQMTSNIWPDQAFDFGLIIVISHLYKFIWISMIRKWRLKCPKLKFFIAHA